MPTPPRVATLRTGPPEAARNHPNSNDARPLLYGWIAARSVRRRIDASHLDGCRTAATLGCAVTDDVQLSVGGDNRPVHAGSGLRAQRRRHRRRQSRSGCSFGPAGSVEQLWLVSSVPSRRGRPSWGALMRGDPVGRTILPQWLWRGVAPG